MRARSSSPNPTGGGRTSLMKNKLTNISHAINASAKNAKMRGRSRSAGRGTRSNSAGRSSSGNNRRRSSSSGGGAGGRSEGGRSGDEGGTPRSQRKNKLMLSYDNYEQQRGGGNMGGSGSNLGAEYNRRNSSSSESLSIAPSGRQRSMRRFGRGSGIGGGNNGGGGMRGISARFLRAPFSSRRVSSDEEWADSQQADGDYFDGTDNDGGMGGNNLERTLEGSGNSRRSFRSRTSKTSHNSSGEQQYDTRESRAAHPWILPPTHKLAPRIDVWTAFTITSCAAVASIGQILSSLGGGDMAFNSGDSFAMSVCVISFVVSLIVGSGMRYAPLRRVLTRPPSSLSQSRLGSGLGCLSAVTPELGILGILLFFWVVALPFIVDGNAFYNGGSGDPGVPLAMAGSSIWNTNLFYSSWISFLLCGYLFIEVYTLNDRRGTLKVGSSSSSSGSRKPNNTLTKRWTLLLSTALILMSASISTYVSPACEGEILSQTSYCKRALVGVLLGGLFQLFLLSVVGALYRLSYMDPARFNSRNRGQFQHGQSVVSVGKRNKGCAILAFVSLLVQSINVGLLTSPTGGGPGNISGTLYFGSWLGFILSFELCLRYLEFYSVGSRSLARSEEDLNVTVFEDVDEEEESYLMLRNGSEDGNQQQQHGHGGSGTKNISINNNLVVVEDASDEEDDGLDQASFVFPGSRQPQQQAPTSRPTMERKDSPPSITTNQHYGGGMEPEEVTSRSRSPASRSMTGSDPVGSIDARSQPRSRGEESSSQRNYNDPDGNDYDVNRKYSGHYNDLEDIDDYDDLGNSAFFDEQFDAHVPPSNRSNEPDAMKSVSQSMVFTSFQMDQLETLDDPQPKKTTSQASLQRHPSNPSNLSPLEEGSNEVSPDTGDSPPNIDGSKVQQNVGDNLRTMQAMRGVISQVQTDRPSNKTSSSKKSGASTRSGSRSRSREKGLSSLPAGASASRGGMHGSSGGGQVSKHSRKSGASGKTGPSLSTQSRGRMQAAKSAGSRMSASTLSSRGLSADGSAILTDDESGSNPPPTISDGMSTKDDLSGFSALSNNKNKASAAPAVPTGGPPPPPFRRSNPDYDAASQYSNSAPVRSIHTTKGSNGESCESIVSDPTLDAGLVDIPSPQVMPKKSVSTHSKHHNSSGSTNSYDKKYSDETDIQRSSSDENPSSQEGSNKVVDNIVAAALAYAEKTHGESDNHGLRVKGSGTTSSSYRPPQAMSGGSQRQVGQNRSNLRQSTNTAESSSIHSFYTESEKESQRVGDKSQSTGNPRYGASAPVDDLVAKALSHAQGQLDSGKSPQQQQQQQAPPPPRPAVHRTKSEYSSQYWSNAGKSVGSMYSEDTGFSQPDAGMHFDC